jgi:hypothetical protein
MGKSSFTFVPTSLLTCCHGDQLKAISISRKQLRFAAIEMKFSFDRDLTTAYGKRMG